MPRVLLLLSLFLAVPSFGALSLRIHAPTFLDANLRGEWRVVVSNSGPSEAKGVRVYVWTHPDPIVALPPEICTPAAGVVSAADCVVDVAAQASREFTFTTQYERRSGYFGGGADIGTATEFDQTVMGREYVVTNTADDGEGSLRHALLDVNRDCAAPGSEPCVVVFRIDPPVPADGWFTIRLTRALPPIAGGAVFIDGTSQSRHTGETSRFGGPEILIDGSQVPEGHGLLFTSTVGYARAEGLVIGGFPGNGIESNASTSEIRLNDLGFNGLRGVQINDAQQGHVYDNVLSNNRRAGGFFWTSGSLTVRGNRVMGNGASGLFFHKPRVSLLRSTAEGNVIENNAQAGIALSVAATGDFAGNAYRNNAGLPIDVGLDGDTTETQPGLPGQGGRIGTPVITSARWDGTATVIEGHVAPRSNSSLFAESVYLYAGTTADGVDEVLIRVPTMRGLVIDGMFTARVERDLRGLWVRAATLQTFIFNWDDPATGTSELSAPLPVE
jgi:hypothetical protein